MSPCLLLLIFLLLLFVCTLNACQWSPTRCGCSKIAPSIHHRIVGGTEAVPHSWPWMVSIRLNDNPICGGTVINSRYVLSAAHCFEKYAAHHLPTYSFVMGHHQLREVEFRSKAKRIIRHEGYSDYGPIVNDIALIELERTINFTNDHIGFICLPLKHTKDREKYPSLGEYTWVVGWGATVFKGPSARELRQVSVPITNNIGCQDSVRDPVKQVCAGYDEGGKDSCQGDSGGPLFYETHTHDIFEQIGIVSFGRGCAQENRPGIYTRVTGYIDWMEKIMKQSPPSASNDVFENNLNGKENLLSPLNSIGLRLTISTCFLSFALVIDLFSN